MGQASGMTRLMNKVPPGNGHQATDFGMALGSIKEDFPEEVMSWA